MVFVAERNAEHKANLQLVIKPSVCKTKPAHVTNIVCEANPEYRPNSERKDKSESEAKFHPRIKEPKCKAKF